MKKTGTTDLPLHGGKAPAWLFSRMKNLGAAITEIIIEEHGHRELLRRLSDPYFFQALGCSLGFDWHSSGLTTTTCGALKEAVIPENLGIAIVGGKGRRSRSSPKEIEVIGERFSLADRKIERLKYASRMSAKVDNTCIQDGFNLYHHTMFFTERGDWAVIQQGMSESYARRYHWLSCRSFVEEPHTGISSDIVRERVLDMTAKKSEEARKASVDLVKDKPVHMSKYFSGQMTLNDFFNPLESYKMPGHHPVLKMDIGKKGWETLQKAYELQPDNYEDLVSLKGMGPKKIRALALLSNLLFGTKASWTDPVKYSYTHGGKDGYPEPVDRDVYDNSIDILREAIENARLHNKERMGALKRLAMLIE